ncbi:hypothetical protein J6P92_06500 [bacterium]|nr:hypothetical protein [bacterium]
MQVAGVNKNYTGISDKKNPSFKNGFYTVTQELDSSVMLSRALVDGCGCTIPWILMANNETERKEKARKFLFDYAVAYLSPFVALPLLNRFATRYIGKLTKNFWSNNHKVIHISNEHLKDAETMMSELTKMSKDVKKNPIESLYYKLNPKKQYNSKLDIDELLKSADGDKEKLRQKIIKSKNTVFVLDCLSTFGILGSVPFINNEITKKKSGQKGFSAEMSMADREIVEKRAEQHEKTKKKKYLSFLGTLGAITLAMSLCGFSALKSKNSGKLIQSLKNGSKMFDYGRGIYMSRLPFFVGYMIIVAANLLASRNSTERKDLAIRQGVGSAVFFGGDLLLGSLFTNLSDRIFGTKLRKDEGQNKSLLRKIFPKVKPLKQVIEEVEQGKISKTNKKVSAGIFWANMLILMGSMGYLIPKAINKMIKSDVEKDVQANRNVNIATLPYSRPVKMEDFIK